MSVAQAQLSARGIKLFVAEHCPYCHKAEIVAAEKKVPFERVLVPLGDAMPGWYKALNPRETVPTLQVDGKKLVYESNLIAQYLDDVSLPAGSLMGGSAVERHRVEFFMSQAGDFTSACYALMRDPFNPEKRQALNDNAAYVDGILASCQKTGPYFFDDVFSMADIAVLPFLIRFKAILAYYAGYDIFAKAPHMKALYAAGVLRPSVRDTSLTAEEYIAQFAHFLPADSPMLPAKGKHVLYQNVMSPFADRARLACALRKLNVFPVEVQLYPQPEWYKFINPRETVPCIITPNGDAIHESQLIVQYVDRISKDESTAPLIPRGDADQAYAVQFFVESVNNFCSAFFGVILNPSKDTKEELEWACRQIERQLEEHPFGDGPFFGGNAMNAGDVVLLPFLVRAKAYGPDMVGGIDVCKEFKRMGKLATAGMELPEAKAIFAPPEVYAKVIKVVVAKLTGRA